jgi:hypothetical protein
MNNSSGSSGTALVGKAIETDWDQALSLFHKSHAETQYLYVHPSLISSSKKIRSGCNGEGVVSSACFVFLNKPFRITDV